jgi:hypothetical protein
MSSPGKAGMFPMHSAYYVERHVNFASFRGGGEQGCGGTLVRFFAQVVRSLSVCADGNQLKIIIANQRRQRYIMRIHNAHRRLPC